MTCIVGIEHRGRVWIGSDSSSVQDHALHRTTRDKIFARGVYIIGASWSGRASNLLQHKLKPPPPPTRGLPRFMATTFVDAVRECMREGGHATNTNGEEQMESEFLVGVRGQLFRICSDFHVNRYRDGFHAVGSGTPWALGVLAATPKKNPRARVLLALKVAERFCTTVAGPFSVVSTR